MQLLSKLRNYLLFVQSSVVLLAQPPLSPGEADVLGDLENCVQCPVFSVECSLFSVQFSGISFQGSVLSVKCLVFRVQGSVFSI